MATSTRTTEEDRIALLRASGATPDNVQRLSPSQRCDNLGANEALHNELMDWEPLI